MAAADTETWRPIPEPLQDKKLEITFSDDEVDPTSTSWYKFEMKFGRFKGVKMNEMITTKEGRRYLRWLKKQEWCKDYTTDAIDEAMLYYYNLKMKKLQSRQKKVQQ